MFTDQFVQFTNNVKRLNGITDASSDILIQDKFKRNAHLLKSGNPNDQLQFPENYAQRYPFQLREIFEYFQAVIRKKDLIQFAKGKLYSEKIINLFFKILEKMNLVQLSMDNYQRQQQLLETPEGRNSVSSSVLLGTSTMKIQYLSTNFVRKLRLQNNIDVTPGGQIDMSQVDPNLMQYFNHDLVLLPFFFDELNSTRPDSADNHKHVFQKNPETGAMEALCGCGPETRAVLVSVKVLDNQVDLFDREFRDHDSK